MVLQRHAASWFWLAFGLLTLIALLPLVLNAYPAMPDYPNHLARMALLLRDLTGAGPSRYYEVHQRLFPNMAMDLVVPGLCLAGLSVEVAARVFAGLALMLPVCGVTALALALHRRTPWLALLAFPIAFNRYWVWGFLNYSFSVGLGLLLLAAWMALRREEQRTIPWARLALFSLLNVLVLGSHLVGFGLYAIMLLSYEFGLLLRPPGFANWRALLVAGLPFVPATLLYLLVFDHSLGLHLAWDELARSKIAGVLSPFISYSTALGAVTMAGWSLGVGLVLLRGGLQRKDPALWVLAVLLLLFLILPTSSMGSGMLDRRVGAVIAFVLLALLRPPADDRRWVVATVVVLASLLSVLKLVEVQGRWQASSQRFADIRTALQALPPGARLITQVLGEGTGMEFPPTRHTGAFAVMDRDAFIPNLFAYPVNGESVSYRADSGRENLPHPSTFVPPDSTPDWPSLCAAYDYALVIGQRPGADAPGCGSLLSTTPSFRVFKLR